MGSIWQSSIIPRCQFLLAYDQPVRLKPPFNLWHVLQYFVSIEWSLWMCQQLLQLGCQSLPTIFQNSSGGILVLGYSNLSLPKHCTRASGNVYVRWVIEVPFYQGLIVIRTHRSWTTQVGEVEIAGLAWELHVTKFRKRENEPGSIFLALEAVLSITPSTLQMPQSVVDGDCCVIKAWILVGWGL